MPKEEELEIVFFLCSQSLQAVANTLHQLLTVPSPVPIFRKAFRGGVTHLDLGQRSLERGPEVHLLESRACCRLLSQDSHLVDLFDPLPDISLSTNTHARQGRGALIDSLRSNSLWPTARASQLQSGARHAPHLDLVQESVVTEPVAQP